jgi:hypothetical protein
MYYQFTLIHADITLTIHASVTYHKIYFSSDEGYNKQTNKQTNTHPPFPTSSPIPSQFLIPLFGY